MKKNAALFLAMLLALTLPAGCGQSGGGSKTPVSESAQSAEAIDSAEATGDISAEAEGSESVAAEPNQGETELDALMEQVAEREVAKTCTQFVLGTI